MTASPKKSLLEPITIGGSIPLRNRICMAALTRNRCIDNSKPTEASRVHYATRAEDGVGLIIAEGTFPYLHGSEWLDAPMMYTDEHADAWKKITGAVHDQGGKIFFQTWHAGRAQNENAPMMKENGYPVLAPSNIPANGGKYRFLEGTPGHTGNITEITDLDEIIEQYRNSVTLAQKAGFDGVEILANGGYLLHSFLCSRSNQRTDKYGGSVENRCRFPLDVVDAIVDVWGPGAVGIKLCPSDDVSDIATPYHEISETYSYLTKQLVARELGFIELMRRGCNLGKDHDGFSDSISRPAGTELPAGYEPLDDFGPMIKCIGSKTLLMVNYGYTIEEAEELMQQGRIDLVSLGRPFIYNPDLISRVRKDIAFATNDRNGQVNYGPYEDPNENYNDWESAP